MEMEGGGWTRGLLGNHRVPLRPTAAGAALQRDRALLRPADSLAKQRARCVAYSACIVLQTTYLYNNGWVTVQAIWRDVVECFKSVLK